MILTPVRSLDRNSIGAEGAKHLSEGLKANKTLTRLEYAAAHHFPKCQHPLTFVFCLRSTLARSLHSNSIGDEGAKHISGGLKENKALTSLMYAAALRFPTVSAP